MQGQRGGARLHQARADLETHPRAVLGPAPHLHRHRQRRRFGDSCHYPHRVIGLVQQGATGPGLRHLLDRAAEVDVDDVGAGGLDHPRRLGHDGRFGAEDLDRQGMLVRGDPQVVERPLVSVGDPGHRDHLRADEPGPVTAALAAKSLHGDPRHRGEDEAGRDLDLADEPGFA